MDFADFHKDLRVSWQSEEVAEEELSWLSALLQLKQLLQAKPFQPALPLVVLVPSSRGDSAGRAVEDGV